MAGITQAQAEARLAEYMAAESAVLSGQSYSIAGRSVSLANLSEIRDGVTYWEGKVQSLSRAGKIRVRSGIYGG